MAVERLAAAADVEPQRGGGVLLVADDPRDVLQGRDLVAVEADEDVALADVLPGGGAVGADAEDGHAAAEVGAGQGRAVVERRQLQAKGLPDGVLGADRPLRQRRGDGRRVAVGVFRDRRRRGGGRLGGDLAVAAAGGGELNGRVEGPAAAAVADGDLLGDGAAEEQPLEVGGVGGVAAGDLLDHVAATQAGLRGGAAGRDAGDDQFADGAFLAVLEDDAVELLLQLFDAHQPGDDAAGVVDGDGEADLLGPRADGDVDADDVAAGVDEGSAGVAGVDGRVDLDQVLVRLLGVDLHVAGEAADDAAGDGVLVAEGVADGEDVLAEEEVGGGADGHGRQRAAGLDLDDRQVLAAVEGDDAGGVGGAVEEGHAEGVHVQHDVVVGDDVAPLVDDDAGAHAVDLAVAAGGEEGVAGGGPFLAVDVDGGGAGAADGADGVGDAGVVVADGGGGAAAPRGLAQRLGGGPAEGGGRGRQRQDCEGRDRGAFHHGLASGVGGTPRLVLGRGRGGRLATPAGAASTGRIAALDGPAGRPCQLHNTSRFAQTPARAARPARVRRASPVRGVCDPKERQR